MGSKGTGTAGYLAGRSVWRLRSACGWSRSEVCVSGTLEPGVRRPGEVVRTARVRSGLTQAELGNRTGYSAAQVSRYERGVTPLRDVSVLRRFARALAISPGELGLAGTGPGGGSGRALIAAASGVPSRVVPSRVAGEPGGRDEDVRRRQLLAALGAAAAGAGGSRGGGAVAAVGA